MNKEITKEWMDITAFNAIDIMSFECIEEYPEYADKLYYHIKSIFEILSKLKTDKVYGNREIEYIFSIIKEEIYYINDIFIFLNVKQLPSLVYEIIYNISEELILLLEDNDLFEGCANLLKLRDYWFRLMMVKIHNNINVK